MARNEHAGVTAGYPGRSEPAAWIGDRVELTPARITIVYLAFGIAALVLSDLVFPAVLSGDTLAQVQAVKGAVEVALTAGLIFALTATGQASLRRTTAQAERQRKEIQLLHRVLRHNLRNNLTLVLGNARRLQDDLDDPSERAVCDEVITAAEEIRRWTRQAGEIRRVSDATDTAEIDLADVVPEVLDTNDRVDEHVDVETEFPERAAVRVSPRFEVAIDELVTNAIQHDDGDRPTVEISVERHGSTTTIEIADDGPGFPEYVLAVMGGSGEDQIVHLDGLGLWLAYLVVDKSDGTFEIANADGGGVVRITVPSA